MSNISMSDAELLKFAIENGMLDTALVQDKIEMQKRKEILDKHPYAIWQGTDGKWRTYLPDEERGRCLKKRNTQTEIENVVIEYRKRNTEEERKKKLAQEITLIGIFPEWLDFKQIHTDLTSYTRRIAADWKRYYAKELEIIHMPLKDMQKLYLDTWAHGMIKKHDMTKKSYYNMSIIPRQCLDYAFECGYVEENEFAKVKINTKLFRRNKKKPSETQVYTQQEEERLIQDMIRRFNNNPENPAPLAVLFEFETGMRIGEVCAVKLADIEGRYIHI